MNFYILAVIHHRYKHVDATLICDVANYVTGTILQLEPINDLEKESLLWGTNVTVDTSPFTVKIKSKIKSLGTVIFATSATQICICDIDPFSSIKSKSCHIKRPEPVLAWPAILIIFHFNTVILVPLDSKLISGGKYQQTQTTPSLDTVALAHNQSEKWCLWCRQSSSQSSLNKRRCAEE